MGLGAEQADHRQDVLVDAQAGEIRIADAGEEPVIGRSRHGFQRRLYLLERGLVAHLKDTERLVDAEPVAGSVGIGLVMRHDGNQAKGVARLRREDDASPEGIDADRAYPVVPAVSQFLQMQAGVGVRLEFPDRGFYGTLYASLQLRVFAQKVLGYSKAGHRRCL